MKADETKTSLVEGSDGVEAYVGRSTNEQTQEVNAAIMKFAHSAREYLWEMNNYAG